MEIVINSKSKPVMKSTGMRKKIVEANKDKVAEFLRLHKLPISESLEENCKRVAKQYEILRLEFDAKKRKGMTPQKFANFEETEEYENYFESELDNYEADLGFSGWESDFSDFKNFNGGLGVEFENYNIGALLKKAKGVAQKVGAAVKKGATMVKGMAKEQLGLGGNDRTEIAESSQVINQVPESQRVIYSQTPLSTVRANVVAEGAKEWLNSDRAKAIDELIKKGEKDKERAAVKAQLISLGVDPRRFTNFVGEDFDVQKAKKSIDDLLTGVIDGEKAKAKNDALPSIILIACVAGGLGWFLARK